MKFWHILLVALLISACSNTISSLQGGESKNLSIVQNIKTIVDVNSVGFEWDLVNDSAVEGFVLYRSSNNKDFQEVAFIANPIATHFVDVGLVPETQYQYYFLSVSDNYYSSRSKIIDVKTSFIDSIENLYASNDYPKKVKLLWTPHSNPSVSEYLVQKNIDGEFKTIASINNRLLVEYIDYDLEDGANYQYRIIAKDFLGNPSRPSKIITAKTKQKPKLSTKLSVTNHLPNDIVLSWTKNNDARYYKIYRSNTNDGIYKLIGESSKLEFIDNIGKQGQSYFYKLSVVDFNDIESELSSFVKGSTKAPLGKPIISKGYVDKKGAQIMWEPDSRASYFFVNRKKGIFGKIEKFKVTQNSFSDKDVKVGDEYTYYVTAVDEYGIESSPSEEISLSIR